MVLTEAQNNHLAKVYPESRPEMEKYLSSRSSVFIRPQTECSDVPPYAICVVETPGFWIDCCDSIQQAKALAHTLDLPVVDEDEA